MTPAERREAIEARRLKVARLINLGKSDRQIARELDVSRTTVWTDRQVLKGLTQ